MKKGEWTFLSNHGRVLAYIAKHNQSVIQEIAQDIGLSIAGTQKIISDLNKGGYVVRMREGRQNRYIVYPYKPLRHPLLKDHMVIDVLKAVGCNFENILIDSENE